MNRIIEILAMALGGLSLFSVCFLGFAIMSGKPLSGIPGLGKAFEQEQTAGTEPVANATSVDDSDAPSTPSAPRKNEDVIAAGIGVMGAWSLPSPFSQVELKGLADELKSRLAELDARERDLDRRERELEERTASAQEQFELLGTMRRQLEEYEAELDLREQEVRRSEEAHSAKERQAWADQAGILKGLSTDLAGKRLLTYTPEEAAHILRSMEPDAATKLLNAIPEESWKDYVDAYTTTDPPGKAP